MISVKSLSYIYNQNNPYETRALDDVSFNINQGETVGIIGPSGSGKSCLLRCLAGVLNPVSGVITFDHQESSARPEIGLIIQEPEIQFFNETVYQEIAFALENRGLTKDTVAEIVCSVLKKTGYHGEHNRSPFHLSGGEQRRVAIACILSLNPQVLLLDEPTVGLDVSGLEMIEEIIADFKTQNKTIIMVSHNMDFLYRNVDRYLVLNHGKIAADFKKSDFEDYLELLRKSGLAIPELVELKNRGIPSNILQEIINLR